MDESTRALLRTISAACRKVGSANDLDDRGGAGEAQRMRDEARRSIEEGLASASEDDRARIDCLFGPATEARFDRLSWTTADDYIAALLARDPDLPVEELRRRVPQFQRTIDELCRSDGVAEARAAVRYTRQFSPSMFDVFRRLVARNGDPPGWFWIGKTSYHLNLAGEGFREEIRESPPEPTDVLVDGVWIHVENDAAAARSGLAVVLRSRDGGALVRVQQALRSALAADGWEELAAGPEAPRPAR